MDDWIITLHKDTIVYKGIINDLDLNSEDKCWFALEENIAQNYAKLLLENNIKTHVYYYKISRDIKLINIFSIKFKYDFWDKINLLYSENNHIDERKIRALLPLGLPSYDIQKELIKKDHSKCKPEIEFWAKFMGGHRFSQLDFDKFMVDTMIKLYTNKYDGYIQKDNVPTCLQDSIFFPKEICIFSLKNKIYNPILLNTYTKAKGGKIKKKGGNMIDKRFFYAIHRENITQKDWNDVSKYIVESSGYKGTKHHKDVNFYDIIKDREKQEIQKNIEIGKELAKRKPTIIYI